ncbi:MAG TPA: NAD(P)/FAD-dependent oxidoreductase [Polyangiaceae bacterium]|nr:NAD(P)/FAD-dependent oxidoreductase [Polyangiaceae bacterium]
MDRLDTLVIGAGVVGLAVARELAHAGHDVVIAESEGVIGSGISARNSEVIHAGIYYPKGSLKALHCVAGRKLLYEYCERRQVPFKKCGKLIVATSPDQVEKLEGIRLRADANGATDLSFIDRAAARRLEPALKCHGALVSPSTGIIDGHALMRSLLGEAEDRGALLSLGSKVTRAEVVAEGIELEVHAGGSSSTLMARHVVNAAGLFAPELASRFEGLSKEHVPAPHFAKGNYFSLGGAAPFSRLVYPVPVPGGLGVHITLDLAGQARFGPDVEWLEASTASDIDYDVNPCRADGFYDAVRRYWPALIDGALTPAYSGVRPKLVPKGTPDADFVIQGPRDHGIAGLVNLFGIESPGLTAALSIAKAVREKLETD